jgi:flagellar protein FliS
MMNTNGLWKAAQHYRQIGVQSRLEEATPVEVVGMLLDGVLARIAAAKAHMARGEVARKGEAIGRAIQILGGLQESLDPERGAEIAGNLERLYDYMQRRLAQANLDNDTQALDQVEALIARLRDAWSQATAQTGSMPPRSMVETAP